MDGRNECYHVQRDTTKQKRPTLIPIPGQPLTKLKPKSGLSLPEQPLERFFAVLLRSPPKAYLSAATSDDASQILWKIICGRLRLNPPLSPLHWCYSQPTEHFDDRTCLILEEARESLSRGLAKLLDENSSARVSKREEKLTMTLKVTDSIETTYGPHVHTRITLEAVRPFTKDQLFYLRPGGVFLLRPHKGRPTEENMRLGVIVTSNRDMIDSNQSIQLLMFLKLPGTDMIVSSLWEVTPTAQLITELRCFEAMQYNRDKIRFLECLLGRDQRGMSPIVEADDSASIDSCEIAASSHLFNLPRLNHRQRKAASNFLQSAHNQPISLIQGPPGTGKTTLLVSIICQYIEQSTTNQRRRRLMVCAPTNKAVAVVASRLVAALNRREWCCNIILVGDADKLLAETETSLTDPQSTPASAMRQRDLTSIFLYTWVQGISSNYIKCADQLQSDSSVPVKDIAATLQGLQQHLSNSIPDLHSKTKTLAEHITKTAMKCKKNMSLKMGVVQDINALVGCLERIKPDKIYNTLLNSADIIFCTLATAGGNVFARMNDIDDLIVDEAAAATEPELCIPLRFGAQRMLLVGDPKQLPATVLSKRASNLGLNKSLQARLMYDCKYYYVMLNKQYRMAPMIASFPSAHFYGSNLKNGSNVSSKYYIDGPLLHDRKPYTLLQINGVETGCHGESYSNPEEARAIVDLVTHLRLSQERSDPEWNSTDKIRIITFYQGQVNLIKQLLYTQRLGNVVVVATVDSSQGCEADIVIVSFVRSPGSIVSTRKKSQAGFLTDDRRLNVALTRAKHQLICVGNFHAMKSVPGAQSLRELVLNAEQRCVVRPFMTDHNCNRENMDIGRRNRKKRKTNNGLDVTS